MVRAVARHLMKAEEGRPLSDEEFDSKEVQAISFRYPNTHEMRIIFWGELAKHGTVTIVCDDDGNWSEKRSVPSSLPDYSP